MQIQAYNVIREKNKYFDQHIGREGLMENYGAQACKRFVGGDEHTSNAGISGATGAEYVETDSQRLQQITRSTIIVILL
jgi:lysophospholipase L1-like esterase